MYSSSIGDTNKLKELPSATTSVVFFLIMTIIYGFIMIYNVINSNSLENVTMNSNNQIYTLIYILFLLSGTYFININISKSICLERSIEWNKVFTMTMIPWIIIFGVLFFLLKLFPGWIKPYANTIGYMVINSLGATEILKNILKHSTEVKSGDDRKNSIKNALEIIEKNYSLVINEIDINEEEYIKFINQLTKEELSKEELSNDITDIKKNKYIIDLFALVNIRDIIGSLFWYVLAGTLIASISYNLIINMSCEKTLEQSNQDYTELYSYLDNTVIIGKKWKKISANLIDDTYRNISPQLSQLIDTGIFNNNKDEIILTSNQLGLVRQSFSEIPNKSYILSTGSDTSTIPRYFIPIE